MGVKVQCLLAEAYFDIALYYTDTRVLLLVNSARFGFPLDPQKIHWLLEPQLCTRGICGIWSAKYSHMCDKKPSLVPVERSFDLWRALVISL